MKNNLLIQNFESPLESTNPISVGKIMLKEKSNKEQESGEIRKTYPYFFKIV